MVLCENDTRMSWVTGLNCKTIVLLTLVQHNLKSVPLRVYVFGGDINERLLASYINQCRVFIVFTIQLLVLRITVIFFR